MAALGVGFTGVMCWFAVREVAAMRTDLGDLAVYVQALWMTMHGQFMQFTMGMDPPGDYLGLHFSPILIALAPLSLAFRDPSYLSVLQVIGLALGAIPIALWAGKRLGHPAAAPVFALAFFLNPVVIGSILIPFHEIVFATAALGAMLYCQLNRRWWLTLLFALLALSVKEEIGFVVVGMGLFAMLFQRQMKAGAGIAALGLVWGLGSLTFLVPVLNGGQRVYFMHDYAYLGASTPLGIITAMATHPLLTLQHTITPAKMNFVLFLLMPFGVVLPLLGWRYALMAVPPLAYIFVGDTDYRVDPSLAYYLCPMLPFVFFAAIEGAAVLARRLSVMASLIGVSSLAIGAYVAMTGGPGGAKFNPQLFEVTPREQAIARELLALPSAPSVSTTPNLAPYVARRADYRLYPELVMPTDVYAIDMRNWPRWGPYPANFVAFQQALPRVLHDPRLVPSYEGAGFVLAEPGTTPAPEHPLDVVLGGVVTLLGYDAPAAVRPGETATVRLFWRAERPLDKTYTAFVHIGDDSNDKLAQQDGWPWEGFFPTPEWKPGELVVDPHQVPVPSSVPPGSYAIRVGMYDNSSGSLVTLNAPSGEANVRVGEIEIRR